MVLRSVIVFMFFEVSVARRFWFSTPLYPAGINAKCAKQIYLHLINRLRDVIEPDCEIYADDGE